MIRLLQCIIPVFLLMLFSCENRQKTASETSSSQSVKTLPQLDSSYNSYRVVMTGVDAELFRKHHGERVEPPILNLNQSLDDLTLSELYILRNTVFAMKGGSFEDAILHHYFNKLPWYQPPFWDESFSPDMNEAEKIFIERIDQKITATKSTGNNVSDQMALTDHAVNTFQFDNLSGESYESVEMNGFVVGGKYYDQPTEIYRENFREALPSYITSDLILYQMHQVYGLIENDIEEQFLIDILKSMLELINVELYSSYEKTLDPHIERTIEESLLLYAIPYAVITGHKTNLIGNHNETYFDELGKILAGEGKGSMAMYDPQFDFSVFKPTGHYANSEKTGKYFKALKWLQNIDLCLNDPDDFSKAILVAYIIGKSDDLKNLYSEYETLKTYFSSQKQQFTFWDLADVVGQIKGVYLFEDLFSAEVKNQIREKLNIREQSACQLQVSLMPMEFQNLFTDLSLIVKNYPNPSPFMLFDALGFQISNEQPAAGISKSDVMENLLGIARQEEARSIDWLSTLLPGLNQTVNLSEPMKAKAWKQKQLNVALASWVLLNERVHITLKPTNENGDISSKKRTLPGYVEPSVPVWNAAITLLKNTKTFLSEQYMLSKKSEKLIAEMLDVLQFLNHISHKQMGGEMMTFVEYKRIETIGYELENMLVNHVSGNAPHLSLSGDMSSVSNVFRRKDDNLFAATGPALEMIIPVEVSGYVYLMRGFVFSYYELEHMPKSTINRSEWAVMRQNLEPRMLNNISGDKSGSVVAVNR